MSERSGVLYVETGLAKRSQVEKAFKDAIDVLDIPCEFRVNLVLDREGQKLGHAYVWITSNKVINALLGKDLDGSDLTEMIDDPDWTPPKIPLEEALETFNNTSPIDSSSGSWADEVSEVEILNEYDHPKISKELPPLTTIPSYDYDDDQLKFISQMEGDDAPTKGKLDNISRAFEPRVDNECCRHVLVCRRVPDWVSKGDMENIFRSYFPNAAKNYPRINFLDKGSYKMVFATFYEETTEAIDVYHMIRRVNIYKADHGKSNKDTLTSEEPPRCFTSLVFSFAYDNTSE
ncbi:unnamed protein product [marine sediment metagenome]|uniref:Uncharacterized protein n=1 Tax=marine sediment metagenome TaxID=412755 RepID=X1GP48_9ZZZZ